MVKRIQHVYSLMQANRRLPFKPAPASTEAGDDAFTGQSNPLTKIYANMKGAGVIFPCGKADNQPKREHRLKINSYI